MLLSGRIKQIMAAGICLALLGGCGTAYRNEGTAVIKGAEQREGITREWEEGMPTLGAQADNSGREIQEADSMELDTQNGQPQPSTEASEQESYLSELSSQESPEPEEPLPEGTTPEQPMPEGTPPEQPLPEGTPPEQPMPEGTPPEQPTPGTSTLEQPGAEPSLPQPGQSLPAVPAPELPVLPPLQTVTPQTGGHIIAIDAGHQARGNKEKEPLGPGSEEWKAKVSSGTRGVSTGVYEYELNLTIAQALQTELEARGYTIVMIRDSHDVDISNKERAETANTSGAEIFLRIHANGSENSSVHGTLTICNTASSPYNPGIHDESLRLSQEVLAHMVALMGSKDRGVWETDTMSGINWCAIPVTIVEMGYMSNKEEDERMQTSDYQERIVQGIADGVDAYFAGAEISD